MSGFSPGQLKKLTGKLDRVHVQQRKVDGRAIDYIEGWFAVSEANAIFGYANWDRETVHSERLFERTKGEVTSCAYAARIRIKVRANGTLISREGTGCGSASSRRAAEAHDLAIKAAETDATKRALATFGNRFGLCLYDKDQQGVSPRAALEILSPDGSAFASGLSPEGFCTALRKLIESTNDRQELLSWQTRNAPAIQKLRELAPALKTQAGTHYADVLERMFRTRLAAAGVVRKVGESSATVEETREPARNVRTLIGVERMVEPAPATSAAANGGPQEAEAGLRALQPRTSAPTSTLRYPDGGAETTDSPDPLEEPLAPSRITSGPRIDKASLLIASPRRVRDKTHLRRVALLPCLVCGRQPSHAHHLRFAQPHGLSQKVSDEFVVPLCFLHHRELHGAGVETSWWRRVGLQPLEIAHQLWNDRLNGVYAPDQGEVANLVRSLELPDSPIEPTGNGSVKQPGFDLPIGAAGTIVGEKSGERLP